MSVNDSLAGMREFLKFKAEMALVLFLLML